jgi:hypothetical protein
MSTTQQIPSLVEATSTKGSKLQHREEEPANMTGTTPMLWK